MGRGMETGSSDQTNEQHDCTQFWAWRLKAGCVRGIGTWSNIQKQPSERPNYKYINHKYRVGCPMLLRAHARFRNRAHKSRPTVFVCVCDFNVSVWVCVHSLLYNTRGRRGTPPPKRANANWELVLSRRASVVRCLSSCYNYNFYIILSVPASFLAYTYIFVMYIYIDLLCI